MSFLRASFLTLKQKSLGDLTAVFVVVARGPMPKQTRQAKLPIKNFSFHTCFTILLLFLSLFFKNVYLFNRNFSVVSKISAARENYNR